MVCLQFGCFQGMGSHSYTQPNRLGNCVDHHVLKTILIKSPMLRKPSSRCTLYKCIRMVCLLLTHEQSIYRSSRYYSEKFPLGSDCSLLDFPEYQESPSHKTRGRMVELVESRRSNFCKSLLHVPNKSPANSFSIERKLGKPFLYWCHLYSKTL